MRQKYAPWLLSIVLAGVATVCQACSERNTLGRGTNNSSRPGSAVPDVAPRLLSAELPFRYPPALYAMHVEGDVTLRLYVTATGAVLPESSRVAASSGYRSLDSAALSASSELRFSPARSNGADAAVSVLFPILFRHPER